MGIVFFVFGEFCFVYYFVLYWFCYCLSFGRGWEGGFFLVGVGRGIFKIVFLDVFMFFL